MEEIIHHLAIFVSRVWQIHVFGEGNTPTTAVFFIKNLRTLGFDATNDIFAENAESDIESQNVDIRNKLLAFSDMISEKNNKSCFRNIFKVWKK